MDFKVKEISKGFVMVDPAERIDVSNAQEIEVEMKKLVDAGNSKLLINFKEIKYISSAGLRIFISVGKLLKKQNGDLRLCALSPHVFKIFKLAGFNKIFTIYDDEETAIADMK